MGWEVRVGELWRVAGRGRVVVRKASNANSVMMLVRAAAGD